MIKPYNAVLLLLIMLISNKAFAHYASVTVDNYNPEPGEEITVLIGFGHSFPSDGELRRIAYDKTNLSVIDPDGNMSKIMIKPKEERGNFPIKVKFIRSGFHTILLTQKILQQKPLKVININPKTNLKTLSTPNGVRQFLKLL